MEGLGLFQSFSLENGQYWQMLRAGGHLPLPKIAHVNWLTSKWCYLSTLTPKIEKKKQHQTIPFHNFRKFLGIETCLGKRLGATYLNCPLKKKLGDIQLVFLHWVSAIKFPLNSAKGFTQIYFTLFFDVWVLSKNLLLIFTF